MADTCDSAEDLLQRLLERCGERPFLRVGDERLTGAEFVAAVRALAAGLRAAGFRRGDRLAIWLQRCADEALGLCAAMLAGGIAVPVNPRLKDDQLRHVLEHSDPWAVLTSATKTAGLRRPHEVLAAFRLLSAAGGPVPGLRCEPFGALRARAPDPNEPAPDLPAVILYTSGSTGLPKGVVQDQRNLAQGAAIVGGYLGLGTGDHTLALLPFSFDYGLNQLLSALWAGASLTAADHLGGAELGALLREHRPTGLAGVPSLWHEACRALATGAIAPEDGASLRWLSNSGGRWPVADVRALRAAFPASRLYSMYGLTEAFRSAYLPPEQIDAHPDSFGFALPGVELLLVDPASGRVLEGPATGELVHAGALVAKGYFRDPEATAARFRPDPRGRPGTVVYSGDLVRRDAGGRHRFVARLDRMLKVAGHRISPDEVTAAVTDLPGAGLAAAFGQEGGADGHRIVLCVQGDPADPALPGRVLARCRAALPAYMVPAEVRILPSLPLNQNGKVDVAALEAMIPPCTGAS